MSLSAQFIKRWKARKFASDNQRILLAVSGGLDSMAMAHLFLEAKINFGIAHCNFQLRGDDAIDDEKFVHDWCAHNNIPFYFTRFETENISHEWKKGIQETARNLRYKWLEETRAANNYSFIATAHHANDNVETLLMNLFKGTGISGLHGIKEKKEKIIRPLLSFTKEQIKSFAEERSIQFREDISNSSDKYLRNAVRLNILPPVQQYFPNAIQQINECIHRFAQAEELYNNEVRRQLKKLLDKRGKDFYIPILKLKLIPAMETICYELFKEFGFSSNQIPELINLMEVESGKHCSSASHKVIKDRNFLIITENISHQADLIIIDKLPETIKTTEANFHFSINKNQGIISESSAIALIDADKISLPLILRRWRIGDYFYPLGMGMKKKKLSKFFIDQKVPIHEKEQTWVVECDKKILWIAGMRIDERFKITPSTTNVLKIEMRVHQLK